MKIIVSFLILLLISTSCLAQQRCELDSNSAPTFFGLRLGMTQEEVRAVFGKIIKFKPKKTKQRTFFQNFIKKPSPSLLQGVRALYLRFLDGRIYQIEFFYENRQEWQTLSEFNNWLSENQNLPKALWINQAGKATLQCAGFTLLADKVLNPRIELTDKASADRLQLEGQQRQRR